METRSSSNTNTEEKDDLGKSRMKNMGNTCYMNSIIQCLNHTPLFREYILNNLYVNDLKENIIKEFKRQDGNYDDVDENDIKKIFKTTIIYQYHRITKTMWEKNCLVTPASFRRLIGKKNDMFSGYMQHDSQEFLIFILDQIHEELSKKINVLMGNQVLPSIKKQKLDTSNNSLDTSNNSTAESDIVNMLANRMWNAYIRNQYSIITELFTGMYHSILESKNCYNKSHAFDPYVCMSVSIPIGSGHQAYLDLNKEFTIYDCLDKFFSSEELDGDNKIMCDRTMTKVDATKKISLWSAPKLLIIQIKRFMKNPYGFTTRKLKNKVTYPVKGLDLTKYTSEYNKKTYKYNLFAVNVHSDFGGINSGHYYSLCKNITNNKWYSYNDEHITEINKVQNNGAYLLFYYLTN